MVYNFSMTITPLHFQAYIKCPTKCWLRFTNEPPAGNPYAEWVQTETESYRDEAAKRLTANLPADEYAAFCSSRREEAHSSSETLKAAKWKFAVDIPVRTEFGSSRGNEAQTSPPGNNQSLLTSAATIETCLHAVERIPPAGRGQPAQFVPIRFIYGNKLTQNDKLLLAFDAFVLSEMLGRTVSLGKIIHGDLRDCVHSSRGNEAQISSPALGASIEGQSLLTSAATFQAGAHCGTDEPQTGIPATFCRAQPRVTKVKTPALAGEVRKRLGKITALLAGPTPPDLVLNRHCAECEFQARCRKLAVEKDDLSLLAGMSAKERQKLRSKGIFTVTQLSYTFRPRRRPKRQRDKREKYHHALKALAIREQKIHIVGSPELKLEGTPVYLDVEGLPDRDFYYLIGVRIGHGDSAVQHSLWADTVADEGKIWREFLALLETVQQPVLIHYGSYEKIFLHRMTERYGGLERNSSVAKAIKSIVNLPSVIFAQIYFPTCSNGLKEIGHFLGYKRRHESATGLQTMVWRAEWQANRVDAFKSNLIQYNQDDCIVLEHVSEFIRRLTFYDSTNAGIPQTLPVAIRTDEMVKERARWELFRVRDYALDDFRFVNKCAYFDYQRERVFVRTHRQFKSINKRHRRFKRATGPNKIVTIECERCPKCHKKRIMQINQRSRLWKDLKFTRTGVKKWFTKFRSYRYECETCGHIFSSEARSRGGQYRYGHALMSWCVYLSFFCGMNMNRTRIALGDIFEIFVDQPRMMRFRHCMTKEYEALYASILKSLTHEKILHVDETTVKLRGSKGYVWVLAGMEKVYYFYKPSREGGFLQEMLQSFSGVLISDFYSAYDSVNCEQQKCIVHFVRDIDDDLLKNPFDTELKIIAQEFGALLRTIVATVDRYGLKSRHLRKHKPAALRFLDSVASKDFSSEVADNYKRRFQKSGIKMFTFLDHDGVPWNNINAEHAIKAFAKYRAHSDGRFSERSLREYLVLASVFQTCEFNNLNVLKFLLAKETTLEGLLRMAGRKCRS